MLFVVESMAILVVHSRALCIRRTLIMLQSSYNATIKEP